MSNKAIGAVLLLGAAAGGAFLAYKSGVFGDTSGFGFVPQGLSPDKDRAQRWLAAQLNRNEHNDLEQVEVMDNGLALETGKAAELARVVRSMRGSIRYENVTPYGIGRPEGT